MIWLVRKVLLAEDSDGKVKWEEAKRWQAQGWIGPLIREGSAWPVLASRTSLNHLVHAPKPHLFPPPDDSHRQLDFLVGRLLRSINQTIASSDTDPRVIDIYIDILIIDPVLPPIVRLRRLPQPFVRQPPQKVISCKP